ncbi:MAG: hypothetical protein SEPTF4163_002953 [Sporothrix epigloea]
MDDPWGSPWNSSVNQAAIDCGIQSDKSTNDSALANYGSFKLPQRAALVNLATNSNGNTSFAPIAEASPWADDEVPSSEIHDGSEFDDNNAFGDWTSSGPKSSGLAIASLMSSWGGFGDEPDEEKQSQNLTPRKRATESESLGQRTDIAWQSPARLSHANSNSMRTPSIRRELSISPAESIGSAPSPSQDMWEKSSTPIDVDVCAKDFTSDISILQLDEGKTAFTPVGETAETDLFGVDASVEEALALKLSCSGQAPVSSRPSSASSNSSRHSHIDADDDAGGATGESQHDSPTTSVGDVHGDSSSDMTKPVSKVQGLVELFDSLSTRCDSVEALSTSPSPGASGQRGSVDFDTGTENITPIKAARRVYSSELETGLDEMRSPASDETVVLSVAEPMQPFSPRENALHIFKDGKVTHEATQAEAEAKLAKDGTAIPNPERDNMEAPLKDFKLETVVAGVGTFVLNNQNNTGGLNLNIPATLSDDLLSSSRLLAIWGKQDPFKSDPVEINLLFPKPFPPTEKVNDESYLDAFIPDYILSDSFTTTSERKAWYRIARHGSSRKHDLGGGTDDDNYGPITWRGSVIRDETVKIVRRWMEEDSFTGKPTLGGGFGGGSGANGSGRIFGWDSAAAPVSLSEVFKKKRRSANEPRELPVATASTPAQDSGSGASNTFKSVPFACGSPPAAVFGWSGSGTDTAGHDLVATPELAQNSIKVDRPSPVVVPASLPSDSPQVAGYNPSRFSLILPPADLAPSLSAAEDSSPYKATERNDDNDDEDWGEMVSSPTVDTHSHPAPSFSSPMSTAPVCVPAPASPVTPHPPLLDAQVVASRVDSILQSLPDLSYMAM